MRVLLKVLAVLVVIGVGAANLLGVDGSNGSRSSPDYVLAISWQPGFCETAPKKPECKSQASNRYDADNFALHGLWPQPGSNIYCDVSEAEKDLDKKGRWRDLQVERIDESIWQNLRRIMPGTRSSLHKHEWVKHGTCTGRDINEYYAQSIWLIERLNETKLRDLFANNIGKILTADMIRQSLDESLGDGTGSRLRVSCKKDRDSDRLLIVELTLGLSDPFEKDADLAQLVQAAPTTDKGCPSGIVDRVGLQ
jgi:ribonuclease T2